MLTTTVTITPEELRVLHNMCYRHFDLNKYFDQIEFTTEHAKRHVFPLKPEDLATLEGVVDRAKEAMNNSYMDLPKGHPDIEANYDRAELWSPFPE